MVAANGKEVPMPATIVDMYQRDFNFDRLRVHLSMLSDIIKHHGETTGVLIKRVTSVCPICDCLSDKTELQSSLSEVHRLVKLYLTIPVTTATAERSF